MNKKLLITLLFSVVFSQTSLSNEQLDLIRENLSKNGASESSEPSESNVDETIEEISNVDETIEEISIEVQPKLEIDDKNEPLYYGYSYFNKDLNFFDNIPTPTDYRLGAGDEVIISLWGEINLRKKFLINKEGLIYYENIGFINISNMTIPEAEKILKNKLQNVYSTLKSDIASSDLMIEISKIKSLNIYFSGEVTNPGIHVIHPFSDIFSALIQSGGPTINGSLRTVQLIRNNKIVSTTDLYSFFNKGINSFVSEKIVNGDVINIPPVGNRILVEGEIVNEGYFEILEKETLIDLIEFAGGLTSKSSSFATLDKIIPMEERLSDDNAYSSEIISFEYFSDLELTDGSFLFFPSIGEVDTKVEILGTVKSPGYYPAKNTLYETLKIAGGFDDPFFRKKIRDDEILILRKDSTKLYGLEYKISYNNSQDFKTLPGDKIFVYENINYRASSTFRVEGEVNKAGTFPLKTGLTVRDALKLAEGLTELSSLENIIVYQEFTDILEDGIETTITSDVSNVSLDFILGSNSVIKALPIENVVRVEGNVYSPGLVAFNRGLTLSEAIVQAGGYKPYSMKRRVYVKKANGEIDKANLFRGKATRLSPGDSVFVPVNPNQTDFDIAAFIADILSVLSNLAAILVVVDNSSK